MNIRAELIEPGICTSGHITACGNAPVLAFCRKLIEAGYDPATRLECYRSERLGECDRGDMLCLIVRSIGEGAKLAVERERFVPYRDKRQGYAQAATARNLLKG